MSSTWFSPNGLTAPSPSSRRIGRDSGSGGRGAVGHVPSLLCATHPGSFRIDLLDGARPRRPVPGREDDIVADLEADLRPVEVGHNRAQRRPIIGEERPQRIRNRARSSRSTVAYLVAAPTTCPRSLRLLALNQLTAAPSGTRLSSRSIEAFSSPARAPPGAARRQSDIHQGGDAWHGRDVRPSVRSLQAHRFPSSVSRRQFQSSTGVSQKRR